MGLLIKADRGNRLYGRDAETLDANVIALIYIRNLPTYLEHQLMDSPAKYM